MNSDVNEILQVLKDFQKTPEAVEMELRLSLSEIIIKHLKIKEWTPNQLAQATGLDESYVSDILHSDAVCTLDTAGRLLFALGVRARIKQISND